MNLGKNIQHLRKQKKITQEQLAEMMSVSRQTISKWEAEEVIPELDKIMALSDLFACRKRYLHGCIYPCGQRFQDKQLYKFFII